MSGIYERGLVVYTDRWAKEDRFLRRLFPFFMIKSGYMLRSLLRRKEINQAIAQCNKSAPYPLFSRVELETQNRCNAVCDFCPVNRNAPQRPFARMSEELFSQIITQLAELKYRRTLSLHSNNEPLLDKRMPEFAAFARAQLPNARINMFTNGSLLTLDLFRTLLPQLDRLFINNYNEIPKMHPNIQEVHDFCKSSEGQRLLVKKTVVIQLRNPHAVLSSRGGSAPNRKPPAAPPAYKCIYPFRQLIIRPDGCISLCCNDALGKMTLGDLNHETLTEVWRGSKFADVRRRMAEQGRQAIPLCAVCDFQE